MTNEKKFSDLKNINVTISKIFQLTSERFTRFKNFR